MAKTGLDSQELKLLLKHVEMIKNSFNHIRQEARDILHESHIGDAKDNLKDVLEHSEKATISILESATHIGSIAGQKGVPQPVQQKISQEIGKIFEACSFQDITGQRLKRIAKQLDTIEKNLENIVAVAKNPVGQKSEKDKLMAGPQLSSSTPSQADIDQMFQNH